MPKNEPEIDYVRLMAELPNIVKLLPIYAKLHRAKYLSLIEQGFDEKQALELCKNIP